MPPSFLKLLKDDHQSITLEVALTHLGLIKVIKAHCLFNADLKKLIQEGFQGRHARNQIEKEMALQSVEFYIWTRKAIEDVRLKSWDETKKKNLLDTRLDPESWFDWLKIYKNDRQTKECLRERINTTLEEIKDDLDKLPTLYPERYEVCDLSEKCDQAKRPARKRGRPAFKASGAIKIIIKRRKKEGKNLEAIALSKDKEILSAIVGDPKFELWIDTLVSG